MHQPLDMIVVGGGINGVGIARDAAGRGCKVLLCERDDLGQHTSSASTKLIHGGLRYLENYEFRLVRESLMEREVLLRGAPHIIWPMRFILPHHKGLRPAWMLRLGLFLYDHIGGREMLPPTRRVPFHKGGTENLHHSVIEDEFGFGFEYSDCWVEDSRMVTLAAMDAQEKGADIRTRTTCRALERQGDNWRVLLEDRYGNKTWVASRSVVNAAGPWVDDILATSPARQNSRRVRLIKGSHIVVDQLYDGDHAYILQNADGRIAFTIPYERNFTLIGTTDVTIDGEPGGVTISDEEIGYLCELVNGYFRKNVSAEDVVWSYSGVRPLFDDQNDNASVVTRDYVFDLSPETDGAPLLSIFGGKLTTFRKLAEQAVEKLAPRLHARGVTLGKAWTKEASLPGGDIADADFEQFLSTQINRYPEFSQDYLRRLARAYGTRMGKLIDKATSFDELGRHFGAGLTEAEVYYLVENEYALTADDILWRRSKLGLHMTAKERSAFDRWFADRSAFGDLPVRRGGNSAEKGATGLVDAVTITTEGRVG